MSSSREENPGPDSISTVTPREVVRMGREALRPLTGLTKHQDGTAPISTSPALRSESRPTMHHPSSNELITMTFSPSERTSSSGSTGENSWRTLRPAPPNTLDTELNVDATDVGRLPPPNPKNDVRRGLGERPAALTKERVEMGRAVAPVGESGGGGARVVLPPPPPGAIKKGRVMVPLAMWYCKISSLVALGGRMFLCGRTTDAVNWSREN